MNRWLTPSTTGDPAVARCLSVPYALQSYVNGALEELTEIWNWEPDGDMTPQECVDAIQTALDDYYGSICDVPQIYDPDQLVFWREGHIVTGNQLLFANNAALPFGGSWRQNTAAINDRIEFNVLTDIGNYSLRTYGITDNNSGWCKVYLDGTVQTTEIDWWSATQALNVNFAIGLTTTTAGLHTIKYEVYKKNPSSTGYRLNMIYFTLQAT